MKKILLSAISTVIMGAGAYAQCATNYVDKIYSSVTKTTVVYSVYDPGSQSNDSLMDIYTPDGDNSPSRPLLILAHGGSFYGGDKSEATIVTLCQNFAKRGYVTASINYRLGGILDMVSPSTAYPIVIKAISDAKAAVRYFTKDAATTNTYRIDPNQVYLGGNSAGAVLSVQYAYIDDTAELDASMKSIIAANGGISGNSGNAGYPDKVRAILNLAGAILDTTWITNANEEAIASFHGTADNTVPFDCGQVLGGASQIVLCGTGVMRQRYEGLGIPSVTKVYPGDAHCPWDGNATKLNEVDSIAANFLGQRICQTLGVNDVNNLSSAVSVYPNPAQGILNFEYSGNAEVTKIKLIDALGREAVTVNGNQNKVTINTAELSNGMYFIEASFKGNQRVVKRVQVMH